MKGVADAVLVITGLALWGGVMILGSAVAYVFGRWCAQLVGWA